MAIKPSGRRKMVQRESVLARQVREADREAARAKWGEAVRLFWVGVLVVGGGVTLMWVQP
jgi:hypothetical protein